VEIKRFLQLAEWGFNVPQFIRNPCTNYGRSACHFLKEFFTWTNRFTVLTEDLGEQIPSLHSDLRLEDAVLRAGVWEASGYEVVFMEYVPVIFTCKVAIRRDGAGIYMIEQNKKLERKKRFANVEFIEETKHRCLIRSSQIIFEKVPFDSAMVYFWWARRFSGVNYSRQIFYDFKEIKELP